MERKLSVFFLLIISVLYGQSVVVPESDSGTKQIQFVQHARPASDLLNFWKDPIPNYTNLTSKCVDEAGQKGSGMRPNFPCNNFQFHFNILNISVGTPAKQFTVALSSGHSHSWLVHPDYFYITPNVKAFDPSASSTVNSDEEWPYDGYSGETDGISWSTYEDGFQINDARFRQYFGAINDGGTWSQYNHLRFDGNIGLAWDNSITMPAGSTGKQLLNYYNITNGMYSIWLGPAPTPGKDGQGLITLGGKDTQHCGPTLTTVSNPYKWDRYVNLDRFSFQTFSTAGDTAIFDTSFPNIVFPDKSYDAIDRLINPDYDWDYGVYTVPCSQANTLQDWVFTFNGVEFRIPAKDYLLDIQLPNNKCVLAFSRIYNYYTFSNYVFGSPFLRNFCTTYSFTVENVSIQLSKAL